MTDDETQLEGGLRAVYRQRTASTAPSGDLVARVQAIPDETAVGPSWMLRASLALAGVAVAAVLVLGIVDRIRSLVAATPSAGVASETQFDPLDPGGGLVRLSGLTFDGIRDVGLWIGVIVFIGLLWWAVWGLFRGNPRRQPWPTRQSRRKRLLGWIRTIAIWAVLWAINQQFTRPALVPGSAEASGVGLAERRPALAQQTTSTNSQSASSLPPEDVYAVGPGQPLTYVVTARNNWPIGVRLLGRRADGTPPINSAGVAGSTPTGLGLLRDPANLEPTTANTVPFAPVDLAPGEEVAIVVAEVGRACASPGPPLPPRASRGFFTLEPGVEFVYEIIGIEGTAVVPLRTEVVVPSSC